MKKTIVILALSGISSMALADNFSGFSAELGFSSRSSEADVTDFKSNGVNVPITAEKIEKTTALSGLALKYTARLNDMMYVGLSYERDLQDAKLGPAYATVFGRREMAAEFVTIKNTEKFVFSPAYKVQDNLLLSLRLGMIRSTTEVGDAGDFDSIKNSGSLVGVGAQYALTNSIFIAGSYDMFSFKDKTYSSIDEDGDVFSYKFKPGGSSINLSVGYRF